MTKEQLLQAAKAAAIRQVSQTDQVEDGYFVPSELADALGISVTHARRLLLQAVKQGKAWRKSFRIDTGTRIYPIPHYKFHEKSPHKKGNH